MSSSSDRESWCFDRSSEDDINMSMSSDELSLLASSSDESITALGESPGSEGANWDAGGERASHAPDDDEAKEVSNSAEVLMNAIMENEGNYVFILSLSGKTVDETSSKAELRRAYLSLSAKVHPDKNLAIVKRDPKLFK